MLLGRTRGKAANKVERKSLKLANGVSRGRKKQWKEMLRGPERSHGGSEELQAPKSGGMRKKHGTH